MPDCPAPSFTLRVLGSGTCVPSPSRFPASYFVQAAGAPGGWLLDCGAATAQRLAQRSETLYQDIDSVFISHLHVDHLGGLLPLLQALDYTPGFTRVKPLWIYGSPEIHDYVQANLGTYTCFEPDFPLRHVVLAGGEIARDNWRLATRELNHSKCTTTLGFRFTLGGHTLVYGADTGPCEALDELARDADLLILEASLAPDAESHGNHLTLRQAGEIARAAGAGRLLLTHFYPQVSRMTDEERIAEVRASGYEREVIFAADDLAPLEVPAPPARPTILHLVRHGRVHNPDQVYYGRLPGYHLSEQGAAQARAVAQALRTEPIAAVFSSPLLRALQTAEAIAAFHPGLTLTISPLLNEIATHFDGRPRSVLAGMNWWVYGQAGPGDETFGAVLARGLQFVADVRRRFAGRQVVAVTHGDIIAALRLYLGNRHRPPSEVLTAENKAAVYAEGLAPGSTTTLIFNDLSADSRPGITYVPPPAPAPTP